jgi:hypothetical protein
MRTLNRFDGKGSGQVVNGLYAQGGLKARLKSMIVVPSLGRLAFTKRAAP